MPEDFGKPLSLKEIQEKSDKYILGTYKRFPVAFYFGQGDVLYDTDQKRYIDFVSGIAVNALGYGEADLVEAIRDQAERLMHTSNLYYNQEQALLAEALVEYSFPGKVFFSNSGTEANEAALKLARSYGVQQRSGTDIVALNGGFHGRSSGSMSMTGQDKIRKGFGPLIPGIRFVDAGDFDAIEKEISDDSVCAVVLELIQGENGVRPLSKEYVAAVRKWTAENGVMLILDEVQTGIGRTGKLFAFENYGIVPDAMTLAKGLGAGFPIGAMVVSDAYQSYLTAGQHGSTFGGNHLAARVAFETLRIIVGRELLDHVNAMSHYIFTRLEKMKQGSTRIKEIRGMGLHIGVELSEPCSGIVSSCMEKGLLINCTAEKTIRLVPPLTVSMETAEEAMNILESVLAPV